MRTLKSLVADNTCIIRPACVYAVFNMILVNIIQLELGTSKREKRQKSLKSIRNADRKTVESFGRLFDNENDTFKICNEIKSYRAQY